MKTEWKARYVDIRDVGSEELVRWLNSYESDNTSVAIEQLYINPNTDRGFIIVQVFTWKTEKVVDDLQTMKALSETED
jgi:hypothetical protein